MQNNQENAEIQEVPQFEHDCNKDVYLGRFIRRHRGKDVEHYDLYYADHGGLPDSVIARFGNDGPDYTSGINFANGMDKALTEAYRRAIRRGLISDELQKLHQKLWVGGTYFTSEHCYSLTLTYDERRAIDWIGHRYFHGDELRTLLWVESRARVVDPVGAIIHGWDDRCSFEFFIPFDIAHEIYKGIADENFELACFCDELKQKFIAICDKIGPLA